MGTTEYLLWFKLALKQKAVGNGCQKIKTILASTLCTKCLKHTAAAQPHGWQGNLLLSCFQLQPLWMLMPGEAAPPPARWLSQWLPIRPPWCNDLCQRVNAAHCRHFHTSHTHTGVLRTVTFTLH